MRALSVKQPWAELIARGKKKKEFRTWSRSCFGELLIVASKSANAEAVADEGLDAASLVFGRAVCVVDFYKVTGDEGDYAWHLRNPRRVEPIEIRGSASLYHVPDARIRLVEGGSSATSKATRVPRFAVRVPPRKFAVRVPPRKGAGAQRAPSPAAVEPKKRPPAPSCPACGAGNSIPIEYGEPIPEVWDAAERGEVELGGCVVIFGLYPAWRCRQCREAFGVVEDDLGAAPSPRSQRMSPRKGR